MNDSLTVQDILDAHKAFEEFEAGLRTVRTVSRDQMDAEINERTQGLNLFED